MSHPSLGVMPPTQRTNIHTYIHTYIQCRCILKSTKIEYLELTDIEHDQASVKYIHWDGNKLFCIISTTAATTTTISTTTTTTSTLATITTTIITIIVPVVTTIILVVATDTNPHLSRGVRGVHCTLLGKHLAGGYLVGIHVRIWL